MQQYRGITIYSRYLKSNLTNPFLHNYCHKYEIILKFCTEHGSETLVICAKIQNNLKNEMDNVGKWDFLIFKF